MSAAFALAFAGGGLGLAAAAELSLAGAPALRARAPAALRGVAAMADAVTRTGREGRDPGSVERRRLLAAGTVVAFLAGTFVVAPLAGVIAAAAGPTVVARVLRARRERYRRSVEAGAGAMALAIADALGGGHSLRSALVEAGAGVPGPAGRELRRVAGELALGARTDDALEAMRARVRAPGIDTVVAAALLQRRAGGDLSRLLRDCARALEDQARLEDEVRSATAQARFTGLLVVVMPVGGALLAELARPGYVAGLLSSFLTAWLAGIAVVLQVVAAVLIRRFGRVRT